MERRSLTDWQSPATLAAALQVTRLTIYRWITVGRVERMSLSARCIRVRLVARDNGKPREPRHLRKARAAANHSASKSHRRRKVPRSRKAAAPGRG